MAKTSPTDRRWDFDRVFRLLLTVAGAIGLFLLVRYLADVLIPLAVALLLAFLLNPIATALESRLRNRTAAVLITVFGCGVVIFAVGVMLVYVGANEISSLRSLVHDLVQASAENAAPAEAQLAESQPAEGTGSFKESVNAFIERQENPTVKSMLVAARSHLAENRDMYLENLNPGTLATRVVRLVAPTIMGVVAGALSFVLGLTVVVVVLLYLVFLLIDYRLMSRTWKGFLPPQYREDIIGFVEEFRDAMSRYFRGQFIIAVVAGLLLAIGFKLIGLRLAILFGLGVGMLNMVPYLQTVALIPGVILGVIRGLETGGSIGLSVLLVLIVFAVVQLLQDALLTPKIMGKSVGLRPVLLLLSVFVWGRLLGFLGLVLAIPLTCLGLAYYRRFVLGDLTARATQAE